MNYPTQKRLKQLFKYCKFSGSLIRKVTVSHNANKGDAIGCARPNGYLVAQVDNVIYRVHKLVWIYCHGFNAKLDIDHINGDRADNRVENLRQATRSINSRNAEKSKRNRSGLAGVRLREDTGKWSVECQVNKKRYRLGCYDTIFDAACARLSFNNKNGFTERHGR